MTDISSAQTTPPGLGQTVGEGTAPADTAPDTAPVGTPCPAPGGQTDPGQGPPGKERAPTPPPAVGNGQPNAPLPRQPQGEAPRRQEDEAPRQPEEETPRRTNQEAAGRQVAHWLQQAGEVQAVYPGFDLGAELKNDRFCQLLRSRVDLRTAYEVVHKDEIIPAAMAYAARAVQQQAVNAILANGARPAENGIAGAAPATVRSDVAHLTKQERQAYARRAAGGERITFR